MNRWPAGSSSPAPRRPGERRRERQISPPARPLRLATWLLAHRPYRQPAPPARSSLPSSTTEADLAPQRHGGHPDATALLIIVRHRSRDTVRLAQSRPDRRGREAAPRPFPTLITSPFGVVCGSARTRPPSAPRPSPHTSLRAVPVELASPPAGLCNW